MSKNQPSPGLPVSYSRYPIPGESILLNYSVTNRTFLVLIYKYNKNKFLLDSKNMNSPGYCREPFIYDEMKLFKMNFETQFI